MERSDLAFAGAAEQARMLAAGTIIAPELLEVYLDRIARLDRELRSYRVVLADSARQEAAAAQARFDAGERLPLLGVPIAIKDDIDVGRGDDLRQQCLRSGRGAGCGGGPTAAGGGRGARR